MASVGTLLENRALNVSHSLRDRNGSTDATASWRRRRGTVCMPGRRRRGRPRVSPLLRHQTTGRLVLVCTATSAGFPRVLKVICLKLGIHPTLQPIATAVLARCVSLLLLTRDGL